VIVSGLVEDRIEAGLDQSWGVLDVTWAGIPAAWGGRREFHGPLGMFDITWLGVPLLAVGFVYLTTASKSRWLLKDRRPAMSAGDDPREYSLEMLVEPGSPLVGRTIEQAGLRGLHGLFLMEIDLPSQADTGGYAGTMALMARSLGIPSRVVIGFTSGQEVTDGEFVVQARNAHAWPELWMSGIGWVRFEPTPRYGAGVAQPDYSRDRNEPAVPDSEPEVPVPTPADRLDDGGSPTTSAGTTWWPVLLGIVIAAMLLAAPSVAVRIRRHRRTSRADARQRIEGTWQEWGDEVRDLGWLWSGAATPRQASNALAKQMTLGEDERAALKRLVWWVEQIRYAAPGQVIAPTPRELRADLRVLHRAAWRAADGRRRLRNVVTPASLLGRGSAMADDPAERARTMTGASTGT